MACCGRLALLAVAFIFPLKVLFGFAAVVHEMFSCFWGILVLLGAFFVASVCHLLVC